MIDCVRVIAMSRLDALRPVSFEIPKSSTLTASRPSARRTQKRFAGFEIAVDDAERVRLGDGLARLEHELDGLLDRQRTRSARAAREVAPLQVLHHDVRSAGLQRPHVDDARDVLALDLDRRAGLADEPRDGLGVLERPRGAGT